MLASRTNAVGRATGYGLVSGVPHNPRSQAGTGPNGFSLTQRRHYRRLVHSLCLSLPTAERLYPIRSRHHHAPRLSDGHPAQRVGLAGPPSGSPPRVAQHRPISVLSHLSNHEHRSLNGPRSPCLRVHCCRSHIADSFPRRDTQKMPFADDFIVEAIRLIELLGAAGDETPAAGVVLNLHQTNRGALSLPPEHVARRANLRPTPTADACSHPRLRERAGAPPALPRRFRIRG